MSPCILFVCFFYLITDALTSSDILLFMFFVLSFVMSMLSVLTLRAMHRLASNVNRIIDICLILQHVLQGKSKIMLLFYLITYWMHDITEKIRLFNSQLKITCNFSSSTCTELEISSWYPHVKYLMQLQGAEKHIN